MSLESLVALNASGMVGRSLYRKLLDCFGSPETILRVSKRDLERVPGIGPVTSQAILDARDRGPAEIDAANRAGARIIAFDGEDYPPALRTLYDHPLVLYVRGRFEEADSLAIGVVGARKPTRYGERQGRRFSEDLARLHVTVISGLARGVDSHAHRGALAAPEGRTIAVLGSGLRRMYPPENARLAGAIAERGAVISEFPMSAAPEPANFPRRNRIIAGLALGLLVVEAKERSGALITADWAMEAGRDVFCVPGSVESPLSRGCHLLIKQGAKLAESAPDILEEIPTLANLLCELPATLSPIERTLLGHLGRDPLSSEQVIARSRLPDSIVQRVLGTLVEKQLARSNGGYSRSDRVH